MSAVPPRLVDLSHAIESGMATYPGLPRPRIEPHVSHAASRSAYGGQAEFEITRLFMVGNTGTYLDSPYHRDPSGVDIAGLPLERLAGLPTLVLQARSAPNGAMRPALSDDVTDHAILLATGWDARWGTEAYWRPAPYLPGDLAERLAELRVALVGTDAWNLDDIRDPARPAHTALLRAGIPIVEHLSNLAALPTAGALLTVVPPPIHGAASCPVRAFALLPGSNDTKHHGSSRDRTGR